MNALGAPIHSPRNSTKIFEELATRAHDMEQSMIASGEAMAVNATSFKLKGKIDEKNELRQEAPQERVQRKLALKEMPAKQYPFLD